MGAHFAKCEASPHKRSALTTAIPLLVFLVGLAIMLYPSFSDIYNQWRQDQLIDGYRTAVSKMSHEDYGAAWQAARAYNEALDPAFSDAFTGELPAADDVYWKLLDVDGNGIMGYVEIPKINVRLPLYHGTSAGVLEHGLGHLAGTSLPVGGEGTHCVISGHRGLPSALLLTDLDQLEKGDRFALHVLDKTLAYEVDQILVVEPDEVSSLKPQTTGDYVTLVTCTPYGVNTQRLLVRGHRVASMGDAGTVTTADRISTGLGLKGKIGLALLALLLVALVVWLLRRRAAKRG